MRSTRDFIVIPGLLVLAITLGWAQGGAAAQRFIALSYHDVQDNPAQQRLADAVTLSTADLVAHFAWLREHGYHPVSIDDLLAAQQGRRPLPDKAVLLSFDDGYASTYTRVFPLLKLFGYPAVVAPLAGWIDQPPGSQVNYGDRLLARKHFLTWAQLKEMADSGLVEIASHSYDLHHGIPGNPQGNLQPAAVTRHYDRSRGEYETEADYLWRIRHDLAKSVQAIEHHTGHRPRVMVWPYGRYNQDLIGIAAALGMPVTLTLDEHGHNTVDALAAVRRVLIGDGAHLDDLIGALRDPQRPAPVRVAHVDLDYLYDEDPGQQRRNLDRLLDRIKALGINTVYLQAFADPDGDGNADALYFPNRHLPVRADLFNRVAWQLMTRSNVRVYAWMPVLSFILPEDHPLAGLLVERAPAAQGAATEPDYRRLTPFSPRTLEFVSEIYEDLARHAHFDGLLFHDDAYLSDFEDVSPAALESYRRWGFTVPPAEIRETPGLLHEWTRRKTAALAAWTDRLTERVRRYRPGIKTARNLYAEVVMNPAAEAWYAQSLEAFLRHYDYVALMAMPHMEGAADHRDWLRRLVARVAAHPGALDKTVFELQSVDWRRPAPLDDDLLRGQMRLLQRLGARNFGYYPDDFIAGHPSLAVIRPAISLATYPYPE